MNCVKWKDFIFCILLLMTFCTYCTYKSETGEEVENTGELSSSGIRMMEEGENTIDCGKEKCVIGSYVVVNPGGMEGDNLLPVILGFGNRDDTEERRWSLLAYSPSMNVFHFMTMNKKAEEVKTEYIFHGDVRVTGTGKGGNVETKNIKASGCLNVGGDVYVSLLGDTLIDLMTDEWKSACKACDFDGRYLYVGMYAEAKVSPFRIYDCIDPEHPVWISPKEIENMPYMNVRGVKYWNNHVYAIFSKEFKSILGVVDVRDKSNPKIIGQVPFEEPGNFLDIDERNQIVYVCGTRTVFSVDVKENSHPEILGKLEIGGITNCLWTVKYQDNYLYCGGRNDTLNTLHIIDVSNPREMREILPEAPVDLIEGMWSLDVEGDYVYISAGGSFTVNENPKFYIVDVKDKKFPKVKKSLMLGKCVASYVKKVGDLCYVSTFDFEGDNFFVIDVWDPEKARVISSGRYGYMIISFCPIFNGRYIYLLFGDIDRRPPFFGLVKQGEFRAGEIKVNGVHITKGNTLKIGDTEITEEQIKALLEKLK